MCRVTTTTEAPMRTHLLEKHEFHGLFAVDLDAIVKKYRRYVVFCHGPECQYSTYSREEYLAHAATCTPWLEGELPPNVTENQRKSLGVSMEFVETLKELVIVHV